MPILGPGESAVFRATVRVPGGTEGTWRWQVRANARGEVFEGRNWNNNSSLSASPTHLHLPTLTDWSPSVCFFFQPRNRRMVEGRAGGRGNSF